MPTNYLKGVQETILTDHRPPCSDCEEYQSMSCKLSELFTSRLGWEGMISLISYGNYWRKCRKILHQHFNYDAAKKLEPILQEKVHNFLAGLVKSPSELQAHNHMYILVSIDDKGTHFV